MSISSELTCSVCLEIYTDPLMLSCMHSYCRKCLQDLHSKYTIEEHEDGAVGGAAPTSLKCPDCRETSDFGPGGIDGLPKNFILANICQKFIESNVGSQETSIKHQDSRSGKHYCFLCKTTVQNSDDQRSEHRYHVTQDLETTVQSKKQELDRCINVLEKNRKIEDEHLEKAKTEIISREESLKTEQEGIQIIAESLGKCLDKRKLDILDKLKSSTTKDTEPFHKHKEELEAYLASVDAILAAARSVTDLTLDEDGKVTFIQIIEDINEQTERVPSRKNFVEPPKKAFHNFKAEFSKHLAEDFGKVLGCGVNLKSAADVAVAKVSENQSTEEAPESIPVTTVDNIPTLGDEAKVKISWAASSVFGNFKFKVIRRRQRSERIVTVTEEFEEDNSIRFMLIDELCFDSDCTVVIKAMNLVTGRSAEAKISFRTEDKIKKLDYTWDADDCHPSIAISGDGQMIAEERWDEELSFIRLNNSGSWELLCGISSSELIEFNSYLEVLVVFAVLSFVSDEDHVAEIGICKQGHEDQCDMLSDNESSCCCSLFKPTSKTAIALKFSDYGTVYENEISVGNLRRKRKQFLHLGFYINKVKEMFKIVNVRDNTVLFTFTDIGDENMTIVTSILNPEKVRTTIKLIPGDDITEMPSCLSSPIPFHLPST